MSDASAPSRTPHAFINLATIRANYRALAAFCPSAETSAVVKADCYGHGMTHVAPALFDEGCRTFFVAYLQEGIDLRAVLGDEPVIYVFNGITDEEREDFARHSLSPICNRSEELELVTSPGFSGSYGIHFDTGMNRLGIRQEGVEHARGLTKDKPPAIVMSHLACADQPDNSVNRRQLESFSQIAALFPEAQASLSATAGIYLGGEYHFDLVRPGIGLYGGGPARPSGLKLKTAMTLTAPILNLFSIEAGETVGYGGSHTARSPSTIATVALGYADGFLRSGGNFGFGVIEGMPCPIVGRISMDLITLDVTDIAENVTVGDEVEFIGRFAGYEIQAEALGTLGYELTSRLGGRISRSWGEQE